MPASKSQRSDSQHPGAAQPAHGGNIAWAAALAGCSPHLILDFSASINPLGPPQSAIAAIQAHLGDLCHYPDPSYTDLRGAIAAFHHLSPDWILPGNGAAELLTWAARDLATLDIVHLLTPAFGDYLRALRAFGANVEKIPLAVDRLMVARLTMDGALEQAIPMPLSPRSHSGWLLNSPHNPTGTLLSRERIRALLDESPLVVLDEAFMDFLLPEAQSQASLLAWVEQYPNLVIVRSLTKFYSLPGLRLGYAIAHPDRLRHWQQWRDPWSVNSLASAAAIAALADTSFQQRTWDWLPPARQQLFDGLAALPGLHPLPGAANYLLVQTDGSATDLQTHLLQQHQILIRHCTSFPELGDRFFRVAVRTMEENQRLLEALGSGVKGREKNEERRMKNEK
ncbi:threonine-phosphate decarboxylase CobD [Thermoleptolyngbya sp. C42_A2020_037]|uniref:threonine-phosphate decarboxylase CobD n=1 Tax=Thermoleptolyngbya sp. C42_A2020_037 TaxID=2747799 RepID=UPI0019E11FCE|nr:threonine-phosphate decarboxylase CobD [Thermoleptolyngbya sp. C42_A2020_037]MBF2086715.1 threonine-phosphate decarboxylase [Thermoleptolyngbya sp. C42_A2020_037]